jgi:hypothetical protein
LRFQTYVDAIFGRVLTVLRPMQKGLLISILVATITIPIWAAKEENATKATKKAVFFLFAYNVFYVLALKFVFFKLG